MTVLLIIPPIKSNVLSSIKINQTKRPIVKSISKTKQQLIDELEALQERVLEIESFDFGLKTTRYEFGKKIGEYFPQMQHMDEAIYVIFDRKYEFVNEKFAEMFGYLPEEVCNQTFDPMTLIAPESRRFIREKHRHGAHGEFMVDQYEFAAMDKDGTRIDCETFVMFVPYKWGVAVHGMLRNITVRKRIDEELQRNRSDLQVVLNSIPTSIFYQDKNHRFMQANKAFCKFLGFSMEQIIGKTLADIFPNLPVEQLSHLIEMNNKVINSGHSDRGFIEVFPSIRGRRWIQNDRTPYRDERGNIIGVICLAIDISELRETEDKLRYLSFYDVLTGLYNRAYFEDEISRLENSRQLPITFISIKLEDLKSVNDHYGIDTGNDLLRQTAKVLKTFRTEDVVARISGDRFAALLPLSDKSFGENALVRLKEALALHNKNHAGTPPLKLSFSAETVTHPQEMRHILKLTG
jgi:diguanylate cyclase (GGDEF)-like protein/PAS domain S-box-containing protein